MSSETIDLRNIIEDYAFYQDDIELNREVTNLFSKNIDMSIKERINLLNALPASVKGYFDRFNDVTLY